MLPRNLSYPYEHHSLPITTCIGSNYFAFLPLLPLHNHCLLTASSPQNPNPNPNPSHHIRTSHCPQRRTLPTNSLRRYHFPFIHHTANMCLYMVVHYGPNPFSLTRLLSSSKIAHIQERSTSEWRVERLSLSRLRELWHLKSRSQEDLNKAEKDNVFDMGY